MYLFIQPRPTRMRRLGGLLALILSAALALGGTTPVSAEDIPAWESPDDAVTVQTTQTETAAQRARRETDDALSAAAALLENPRCNDLVSGFNSYMSGVPAGGTSARTVLAALMLGRGTGGDGRIQDHYAYNRQDDDGILLADAPYMAGIGGTINLYQGFHDVEYSSGYFSPLSPSEIQEALDRFGGPPTPPQLRAMVILHEVAHLTGAMPRHTPDQLDYGAFIDLLIFEDCVRGRLGDCGSVGVGGPPPVPCPDNSGGGGDGVIIVSGEPDGHEPGQSEDPVLGDCCDEVTDGDNNQTELLDPDNPQSDYPILDPGCCEVVPDGDGGDSSDDEACADEPEACYQYESYNQF